MTAIIYTDGSCLKNPDGPSGWAFHIKEECGAEFLVCGSNKSSTNNRMELEAVINAIEFSKGNSKNLKLIINTDSDLTIKCATGIYKIKANLDLWDKFNEISKGINIEWIWVKAHNGNYYNEIVDKLARKEATIVSNNPFY